MYQGVKMTSEDMMIEREARERVATMLHRSMGTSTDCDFSVSLATDSFDGEFIKNLCFLWTEYSNA